MTDQKTETGATEITTLGRLAEIKTSKVIVTADRLRKAKPHRVEVLKQDISFQGLLQPILVQENDLGFMLVDGLQRLEALKQLNFTMLNALVLPRDMDAQTLRYCQVMANINREDLTKLERAEYIAELDAAWKAMNPSARHGGDRRSAAIRAVKEADASDDEGAILGLSAEVALKTGLSRRAFFECLKIARDLIEPVKIKVRLVHFENEQKFLLKLAQQPAELQEQIIDLILDDTSPAKSIEDALQIIEGNPINDQRDKVFSNTVSNWSRMSIAAKEVFIDTFKDDFLRVARAKGWTL